MGLHVTLPFLSPNSVVSSFTTPSEKEAALQIILIVMAVELHARAHAHARTYQLYPLSSHRPRSLSSPDRG